MKIMLNLPEKIFLRLLCDRNSVVFFSDQYLPANVVLPFDCICSLPSSLFKSLLRLFTANNLLFFILNQCVKCLTVTQEGLGPFRGYSRISGEGKLSHIYHAMMKIDTVKLYLKKMQKIYKSLDTPLEFCRYQHFFSKNQ